jgi:hypothetical protein
MTASRIGRFVARAIVMAAACAALTRPAAAQTPPLTQLQFDIVGVRLVVDPPVLTVPKNIPTQINTSLVLPDGIGTAASEAIATLTNGALVEAELRGPSLPPTRIVTQPGQPIPIPPLAIPGDYFLDGIKLVKNGQTILDATTQDGRLATTIPIRVISEVFVTSVTSRPLSLDEIRGKGIVIDETNFRTVSFQVAFNIDGTPFTIDVPAALPTPEFLQQRPTRAEIIQQVTAINQALRGIETRLPPQFDRPGLNFSIAALPFFPVLEEDGGVPELDIPPITGLVVIPGNVAFLNQFFSVLLMVTNVAPNGTPLELRDATATIVLPPGADRVLGTHALPGDDPLRLARLDGVGIQPTVPVIQLGTDGVRGTADDILVIPAQKSGSGEFLVEGLKEGSQVFDLEIRATLFGLPSGPVPLMGQAAGAVFVRNPTFSVTLAHPRTIRSGERYDLYATVTNTSQSPANLVRVGLEPRAIAGAQLISDATVSFDAIAPGQAATARFTLIAQKTGEVTFSSFTGSAAAGGGIQLTTGVDERGVPLAPNAIILPKSADRLPAPLLLAAQRVLGQAFSIATAPAEALPAGVLYVKRQTVIDHGVELAQAGERLEFGEPWSRVIQDLMLDWLGNTAFDTGFDQILRSTEAGAAFLAEIAAIVQQDVAGPSILDYQRELARTAAGRHPHLSGVVGAAAGVPSPLLTITRSSGGTIGRSAAAVERTLVSAAAFDHVNVGGDSRLAVIGRPETDRYRLQIVARANGTYDLGAVVPGTSAGQLVQLRYPAVVLDAGGTAYVDLDLTSAQPPSLHIDRAGDGAFESHAAAQSDTIVEEAPTVLGVRQLVSASRETAGDLRDPATYGLLVGVLFSKPVSAQSAEVKSHYAIGANTVIGARLQSSGRLVYLYLERPIGALVPRSLTVSNVADPRGHTVSGTRAIDMALSDGARVFGQVRTADGRGVPSSVLKLTVSLPPFSFDVSTVRTDANGSFDFDFVPRIGNVVIQAQHPVTFEIASLTAKIRGQGEQLLLNPTFQGRGLVRGRILAADGVTPVADAQVALIPGSVNSRRGFQTRSNALGEFAFADAPVGVFTISAADSSGGFGQTTGVLPSSGAATTIDVVLTARAEDGGHVVGRVFMSDGSTPGAGFAVYIGSYDRQRGTISAVDRATTDATGTFAFARTLPPGQYDVVALDPGTQQLGAVRTTVSARQTSSVAILLEATGAVEGVVFNARNEPVAGALVAGGLALVETDANGFFRIEGVPAGRRTIEAGDPVTRRRGAADVIVLAGQTVSAAIKLEARATITGRVLDATGTPVPRATVRLPVVGGYTFVFANDSGVYRFPDLPLGDHLVQAPGPPRESMIQFMQANGIDPRSAFTSGDIPASLGGDPEPTLGDRNAILAAYQGALRTFLNVDESILGLPMATLGGFGWSKVTLFQDSTTEVSDVRFLARGSVSGHTTDADGRPIAALTRITALAVSQSGFPTIAELKRLTTPAGSGAFAFSDIPRFDLATFQIAGVRSGDFTIDAAHPFSPVRAQVRGQLSTTVPNMTDVVVQFPSATQTNGTLRGRVLMPDGASAPNGTQVAISFGDLAVSTDADGRFESLLPIPAGTYTVTAQAVGGLRGQTRAIVPAGGTVDVHVQLLGLGSIAITVKRTNGQTVPGASVTLERGTFPNDKLNGTTDQNGQLRFVNVSEGLFSVRAEEALTGLDGLASGSVIKDAEIAIPVTIAASGRVTGTFISAGTAAPIPFAQVVLSVNGVQAFTTTDVSGRFALLAIPVGAFVVQAHDPSSGRLGRTTGDLRFEGETVDVTVVQLPRGVVTGWVFQADGVTIVPGALVSLLGSGPVQTDLQASTRPDGTFRFEGISSGEFTLSASDPIGGFKGTAKGRLTFEGETVDQSIKLAPFASLRVTLRDTNGQPATNATATVSAGQNFSRTSAVDASGVAIFDFLPLGTYLVVGRSLGNPGNGGQLDVNIDTGGQTADVTVAFRGAGTAAITVVGADGVTPVASARVTLNASAAAEGARMGALATTLVGFTNASGVITFQNVPVGAFAAFGEAGALGGASNGEVVGPGSEAAVTIRLGASGTVAGRVLLPDGVTPAAQAIVTLRFTSQSGLQSGVVQMTTPLNGLFSFSGIPVGPFTLSAFEVVSSGLRTTAGTLASNGQRLELGDVILDNAAPRVVSIEPADGSRNVALQPSVVVTFNEPMRPGSFSTSGIPNVALLDGTTPVQLQSLTFSNSNRSVTIRPQAALRSTGSYTLTIRGGQDGPRDEAADLPMLDPFVSTFTTADTIAPAITGTSPTNGQRQVGPDVSVRVAFSESIASGALTVRDGAGAIVAGGSTIVAGNTAVSFVPAQLLLANTTYTVTLTGVLDTGGNALAGGPMSFTFTTIDTIGPVISSLQITGVARPGAQISISPTIAASDVHHVEFLLATQGGNVGPLVTSTAPFTLVTTIPATAQSLSIVATAFDEVGNRSSAFGRDVDLQPNAPPAVTLRTVVPTTHIGQGQAIEFEAIATDDDRVDRVALSAVGAASFSDVRTAPAGVSQFTTRFTVQVPETAASGTTLTAQVVAIDAAGAHSPPATLSLPVVDGVKPAVTIQTPLANAVIVAGQALSVVVDASDDVGVASVALVCAPVLTGCESRTLQPAQRSTRQTFTVSVPASFGSATGLALLVVATDAAGNSTQIGRQVTVPDAVRPALTALTTASGTTQVLAGATVTLRATVNDNVGVTALLFQIDGPAPTSGTSTVSPPVTSGQATLNVTVPASAASGSTLTVRVRARDAAGEVSDEVALTLTVGDSTVPSIVILSPAEGTEVNPGQTVTVAVRATDDAGVRRLAFSTNGVFVTADSREVTPATTVDANFALTLPATVGAGTITFTARAFDGADNASPTVSRTITVRDVAAPAVTTVTPVDGATNVDRQSAVTVTFSEPMSPTTLTAASVHLTAGGSPIAAALTVAADDRTVTLTPSSALALNTLFTLTVGVGVTDRAGNALAAPFTSTFSTSAPDTVGPRVDAIDPPDEATGVGTTTPVSVTFTEPIDPATVTPASFRVSVGGTPAAGLFTFLNGNRVARFTPAAPWPLDAVVVTELTGAVADVAGNALVTSSGQPIVAPLTFTFLTGTFAITSPAGTTVLERSPITISTQAEAALSISSVVFSVNGTALPTITSAPFTTTFTVPARSTTPSLVIVAIARNSANVEVARAEKTVEVVHGLTATPTILGLPRGATRTVTFSIAEAAAQDLAITLAVDHPLVATVPTPQIVLPAGQTSVTTTVTGCSLCPGDPAPAGRALGNTAIVATSARGPAVAIVSVSDPVAGQSLMTPSAPTGLGISLPPSAGHAFIAPGQASQITVTLLQQPLAGQTPLNVTVISSNPAIATATAAPILPGQQSVVLTITAHGTGIVTFTLRAGTEVRSFTVFVGPPPANVTPLVLGAPVGVSLPQAPSAGQVLTSAGRTVSFTVRVLSAPNASGVPIPVQIISSNPAVATATATPVEPGSMLTTITVTTLANGFVSFTLRAGNETRSLGVFVRPPASNVTPLVLANAVGVSLPATSPVGRVLVRPGAAVTATLGVQLLTAPNTSATTVTITSSNTAIVGLSGGASSTAIIPAGSVSLPFDLFATGTAGAAILRFEFDGIMRELLIVVGDPPASQLPAVTSPPIGVRVGG